MPDYSNGKIYKLINDELNLTYYGSTTTPLYKRMYSHKSYAPHKRYTSHRLFETGNVDIVLVENFSCENKEQLNKRERFYIENNDCVNKNIPTRTQKEFKQKYYQDNLQFYKEHNAEYREQHKEEIVEQKKEHYAANRQKILDQKKEYYQANKERIKQQRNEYYHKNKNKI